MKKIMYSILLVVEKPDGKDPQSLGKWQKVSSYLKALTSTNKDLQYLGENCLLISLHDNLLSLYQVLEGVGLSYQQTILNEEIKWLGESKEFRLQRH